MNTIKEYLKKIKLEKKDEVKLEYILETRDKIASHISEAGAI